MNTGNVAVTRLKNILQTIDYTKQSIHKAQNDMRHEYGMLGITYHDRLSEQLENAMNRCCKAMAETDTELNCCREFLTQIISVIEEYDSIRLEDKLL